MAESTLPSPTDALPRLYAEFAHWWPLLSPPSHYGEEADDLLPSLMSAPGARPRTLLELGSGGGSLAFHLKKHLQLTLSDRSPQMLAVSRAVNPECEHLVGDMGGLDLKRTFDLVLIHDAIMYATTPAEVRAAIATAHRHCRLGGALAILPACVRETFEPETSHGGEDAPDGRGLRYLDWTWDPEPDDDTFLTAYSLVFRDADGSVRSELDVHRFGLFSRVMWFQWLTEAGFEATSRVDPWKRDVFIGVKVR